MVFISILILTTLAIAGSAAFFSIYGLAQIFTGAFWPVVIMASSLEIGKLVSASFVYRYWKKINFLMKSYLVLAIIVLMIITSAGIFGMLAQGYQQDILPLEQKQEKIRLLETEKIEVQTFKIERIERRKQIDKQIADLPTNYITARQRLLKSFGPELKRLQGDITDHTNRLREITEEIHVLKQETLVQQVHTGPIVFISKVFEVNTDTATKWVIMLIIFAFDPLAVVLTIGINMMLLERRKDSTVIPVTAIDKPVIIKPIVDDINANMTIDELERMMKKINQNKINSPEEEIQRTLIQEILAKKRVKQKIRKGIN